MSEHKFITVNRSYKLKCYPTFSKAEIARYTVKKFNEYLNDQIKEIEYNFGRLSSTQGKGRLYNKAQKCAKDTLVKAQKIIKSVKNKILNAGSESTFFSRRNREIKKFFV